MSQRYCLFYAGYSVNAPSVYFEQLALHTMFKNMNDEALAGFANKHLLLLDEIRRESDASIEAVYTIASAFKVPMPPKPHNTETYTEWKNLVFEAFEKEFPMTRIDHYYFLFGRRLSEINSGTHLLSACIELLMVKECNTIILKKTDKVQKYIGYVLFKTMAAAALLSGEHRHHYIMAHYKEIDNAYQTFATFDGWSDANNEKLQSIEKKLRTFQTLLANGFISCCNLFKEMGI